MANITVGVPVDATAGQLRAVAALLDDLGAARWGKIRDSCERLGGSSARWQEPAALLLERLAGELRRAAGVQAETVNVKAGRF